MPEPPIHEVPARLRAFAVREERVELVREAEVELAPGPNRVRLVDLQPPVDLRRAHICASSAGVVGLLELPGEPPPRPGPDHARQGAIEAEEALIGLLGEIELPDAVDALAPEATWSGVEHILATRAEAEARLSRLRSALEDAPPEPPRRDRLEVHLHSRHGGPCRVLLTTDAGWGTWRPEYTLEIEDPGPESKGGVRLLLSAAVHHASGAQADDVEVELGGRKPPPPVETPGGRPWMVRSDRGYDERSAALQRRVEGRADPPAPPPSPARLPGEADAVQVRGPAPAEATPRRAAFPCAVGPEVFRVPLETVACRVERELRLRPAVDPSAHLALRVFPGEPLPAGAARVVKDGALQARLDLPATERGEPWHVHLGPEPRLVGRRVVRTRLRVEGLLQREDVHEVDIEVEVESALGHEVSVLLEDRIPIAVDPRLRVNLVETGGLDHEPSSGLVSTRLRVPPGGAARRVLRYTVTAPHDYRLVQALGLDA